MSPNFSRVTYAIKSDFQRRRDSGGATGREPGEYITSTDPGSSFRVDAITGVISTRTALRGAAVGWPVAPDGSWSVTLTIVASDNGPSSRGTPLTAEATVVITVKQCSACFDLGGYRATECAAESPGACRPVTNCTADGLFTITDATDVRDAVCGTAADLNRVGGSAKFEWWPILLGLSLVALLFAVVWRRRKRKRENLADITSPGRQEEMERTNPAFSMPTRPVSFSSSPVGKFVIEEDPLHSLANDPFWRGFRRCIGFDRVRTFAFVSRWPRRVILRLFFLVEREQKWKYAWSSLVTRALAGVLQ